MLQKRPRNLTVMVFDLQLLAVAFLSLSTIKAKIELEIYHKLRIFLHLIQVETLSEAFQKKRTLSSSPEFF